jgi:hypothetical protein
MKYGPDDVAPLGDVLGFIRRRRQMFIGRPTVTPDVLATMLVGDALYLNVTHIEVQRSGDWWIVVSEDDWIAKANVDLDTLFNRIIPIPGVVNSHRAEVVVNAFASAVFTAKGEQLFIPRGDVEEIRSVVQQLSLGQFKVPRIVGFRLNPRASKDALATSDCDEL